jgi:hypothetical protein
LGANPVVEYLKQHDREYQTPEHYAHHKDGMRRHYATLAAGARRLSH